MRIGIIGFGSIGNYVYDQVTSKPELAIDVAFVHNRSTDKLARVPRHLILERLANFADRGADLVVELAHPTVTRTFGVALLRTTDYMPLSLTALSDADLEQNLVSTALDHGTRLLIPHGAVVGMEAINDGRELWDEVTMVMKKNPRNLDFSDHPSMTADMVEGETVIYDGPTRAICSLFPRNVNAHAALALGGIGFDSTRSVLIAIPGADHSTIEIQAKSDGVELQIRRLTQMIGVSGVFTLISTLASITRSRSIKAGRQLC